MNSKDYKGSVVEDYVSARENTSTTIYIIQVIHPQIDSMTETQRDNFQNIADYLETVLNTILTRLQTSTASIADALNVDTDKFIVPESSGQVYDFTPYANKYSFELLWELVSKPTQAVKSAPVELYGSLEDSCRLLYENILF